MKDRSEVGNRSGNPSYRTPSRFKNRQVLDVDQSRTKSVFPKKKPYNSPKEV